ncbi:hypothetical protein [Cesiribacter sp. SM1]|uniref:hypothetical protein n=1 Tax=Cesiribacter sp. SM1 TaxID=2861196 RepID=UPI001CD453FB|nr:hypothetical protein [Cesiribacter sp. SM1]
MPIEVEGKGKKEMAKPLATSLLNQPTLNKENQPFFMLLTAAVPLLLKPELVDKQLPIYDLLSIVSCLVIT